MTWLERWFFERRDSAKLSRLAKERDLGYPAPYRHGIPVSLAFGALLHYRGMDWGKTRARVDQIYGVKR